MPAITTRRQINAPRERVWEAMSDFANAPRRTTSIVRVEMLAPGPVRKGTRFKETRIMFKREATETMEVVEWSPPQSYTLEANSCGCRYLWTVSCRAVGSATEVQMTFDAKPLTFMARVMTFLMGWMMKSMCLKATNKDIDDIARFVEGGGAASPAARPAEA